ncbi:hypothetical protein CERSUDRAFT_100291 [Gelatoporia subvermispora B]|uniref:DUF6533 domain-containing protein n=1 Tax=Ceriporiopsis subvermispora (strain B) TaxID=914234 RepID=M2R044_CERS8|nr:hypothetical protein CERSUDRAFT_100291 [Gelatoporia subvermispora B]
MSRIYGPLASQIASLVSSSVINNYCAVASAALVLYDHICTIPQEVQLIWGSKVTSTMVLFHANRWLNLAYAIQGIVEAFLHAGTIVVSALILPELAPIGAGRPRGYIGYAIDLCLFALWAAFSGIRVYALSGGSRLLSVAVTLLSMVPVGTNAYGDSYKIGFQLVAFPVLGVHCLMTQDVSETTNTRFMYVPVVMRFRADMVAVEISTRVPVIIADIVVLVLTWWKTWATVRMAREHNVKTPLMNLLLRDGTLYFVCLLLLNALNIAGTATNVFTYAGAFSTSLSSIIITHFLLNLRQLAYASDDDNSRPSFVRDGDPDQVRSHTSSLRFGSFVGNMGESLGHDSENGDADLVWDDDNAEDDAEPSRPSAEVGLEVVDAPTAFAGENAPRGVGDHGSPAYNAFDSSSLVV